ncbi:MAG: hypothetical protein ACLUTA_17270 [Blautia wexlerae]
MLYFYTMCLVIALIICLLLLVLGNRIQETVSVYIPFLGRIIGRVIGARTGLVLCSAVLCVPAAVQGSSNRPATFRSQIPGALIIAIAWSIFSYGFSF